MVVISRVAGFGSRGWFFLSVFGRCGTGAEAEAVIPGLNMRKHPWTSSVVMVTTVVVVVATHDLAQGVLVGVLLSGIFFTGKVQKMFAVVRNVSADGLEANYIITGQIFFASVDRFTRAFLIEDTAKRVTIDVHAAHFWDIFGVSALEKNRRSSPARWTRRSSHRLQ